MESDSADINQIAASLQFKTTTKQPKKYKFVADGVPGQMPPMSYTVSNKQQPVVTVTSDGKETQNVAEEHDIIMSGPSRENYVVKASKFPKLYTGGLGSTVVPEQGPRTVAEYTGNTPISFKAPWGEQMVLKPGDYLVKDGDAGYYRIAQAEYKQTYNPLNESTRNSLSRRRNMMEDANLDKAQTLLAAKDITDRLQKMAEDAAKMAVDDLMPLVDTMKDQFGLEPATAFNNVVKQQLQTVLDSIIAAKDQTDNAINTMETGGMPAAPSDIGQPLPPMGGAAPAAPPAQAPAAEPAMEPEADAGAEGEIDFEKEFAAMPATSGPEQEPLGRAKKEVAEATLTPAQQELAKGLAQPQVKKLLQTRKKEDGTRPTSQELADAKKLMTEKLTKKMTAGEVISDFVHSDKFPGKSKAERTKMALGAYYGMHPEKKLKESRAQVQALKQQMDQDIAAYYAHVGSLTESWIQQQGDLHSAVLQAKVIASREQLQEAIAEYKQHKEEFAQHVIMQEQVQTKLRKLEEQMSQTPYGVKGQLQSGATFRKFFESAELRDTWVRYNRTHIQNVSHVTLSEMQQVADRLRKLI